MAVRLPDVMQKLYEAEIPGEVVWLFDGGFAWELHCFSDNVIAGTAKTADEAAQHMGECVAATFPDSPFAFWWIASGRTLPN
jgi:hypothetical protein